MPHAQARRRHAPATAQQPELCLCRGGGGGSRRCSRRQRVAAWLVVMLLALMSVLHGVYADPAGAPSAAMSKGAAAAKPAIVPAPTQQYQNRKEPRLDSDQILSEVSVWS